MVIREAETVIEEQELICTITVAVVYLFAGLDRPPTIVNQVKVGLLPVFDRLKPFKFLF